MCETDTKSHICLYKYGKIYVKYIIHDDIYD